MEAVDLKAGYGPIEVLRGISFKLNAGEILAVAGPNGSGKTTLLKALLGIIPIRGGTIKIFGHEGHAWPDAERDISYIPQRLQPDRGFPITLNEMLMLNAKSAAGKDFDYYVGMLHLEKLLDRRVGDLSGGELQRAMLAYSVIKNPKILIMDEPTSWVDARGADCVLCMIEEFRKKGIAMMIVTHDFRALRAVATHVLGIGGSGEGFYLSAEDPGVEAGLNSLFGTDHHDEGLKCAMCGERRVKLRRREQ